MNIFCLSKIKIILIELKNHAPLTLSGAFFGVILYFIFLKLEHHTAENVFYVFHPLHVFLSAYTTASIYLLNMKKTNSKFISFLKVILVGYLGSVAVSTISDSLIPYWAETFLNMSHRHIHIGFVEKWWIVNPIAVISTILAIFFSRTKISHLFHVLISTCASLFHFIMAGNGEHNILFFLYIFIFLFLAVWLPCCFSDIVFPLLFTENKIIKFNKN